MLCCVSPSLSVFVFGCWIAAIEDHPPFAHAPLPLLFAPFKPIVLQFNRVMKTESPQVGLSSSFLVLRALRRLKGTSNNKKEKMPAETKQLFDQLTEDAMKLMENGDYNVYDEKQEVFQPEAG
ncbi:uncharacterized protein LOC114275435 [Camellia sinensis]|uniref:uncharacterized protein LOC114275435 n=1 Tax=Camellia sinensis TaxID=4442 RepID=UPI001035D915|nr:uncharacterized protein LOC114275435 [Camellia sinensis]